MRNSFLKKVLLFLAAFSAAPALGDKKTAQKEVAKPKIISIGKIDGEASGKMSLVTIRLNERPSWKAPKLSSHGTFLQMRLPSTIVADPGVFYDLPGPWFKKVVAYQADETDAIVRIFTGADAEKLQAATETDLLNRRLVVSLNHNALPPEQASGKAADTGKEPPKNAFSAAEKKLLEDKDATPASAPSHETSAPSHETIHETQSSAPSRDNRRDNRPEEENSGEIPDLNGLMIRLAWYSGAMFLLVLLVLSLKRFARNKKLLTEGPAAVVPMKTLNDLVLAPRQKLSLVQVGGEKLLLSVSPDGISLISHLDDVRRKMTKTSSPEYQETVKASPGFQKLLKIQQQNRVQPLMKTPPPESRKSGKSREVDKSAPKPQNPPGEREQTRSYKPISYAVDDTGVHPTRSKKEEVTSGLNPTEKAIDDVTQLIREKLKSLPRL